MTAVVELRALRVQDDRGAIHGLDLALPAGPVGALIGAPGDGTTALSSALAGRLRPSGGTVRVNGVDPLRAPGLRSRMGVLLDDPDLPDVGRVRDLIVLTRRLRGGEAPRATWYEPLGLEALAPRSMTGLTRSEARTVALGLALAVPNPVALVLFDPLSEVGCESADVLRALLVERSQSGACVLVLTPSVRDATVLADDVATLEQGRIGRAIGAPDAEVMVPGSPVELQVWCDMGRAFASALLLEAEVTALNWSSAEGVTELRIRGVDVESCADAVARVAVEQGVVIHAMQPVLPGRTEVTAASAGIALAMRRNAAYAASLDPKAGGAR